MTTKQSTFDRLVNNVVRDFGQSRPMRANTLLLSVYGDSICPYYDCTLWIGSLIELLKPLGISQRLVRTSIFRLSEKGILVSKRLGRRSYYSLTPQGKRQFESASERIYAANSAPWDGRWRMLIHSLGVLEKEQLKALRKELSWLGFSRLLQGTYIHPTADMRAVQTMLEDLQISKQVVTLYASEQTNHANQLIMQRFNTQAMDAAYRAFVERFQPIADAAANTTRLNPQACFFLRTLLINEYRIILLHQPELPSSLSSQTTMSHKARQIVKQLYVRIRAQSDAYFLETTQLDNTVQSLPLSYHQRFTERVAKKALMNFG